MLEQKIPIHVDHLAGYLALSKHSIHMSYCHHCSRSPKSGPGLVQFQILFSVPFKKDKNARQMREVRDAL